MKIQLLPEDFDEQAKAAVKSFWATRVEPGTGTQGGTRDGVIGGKNLDAFVRLVTVVARHCGLPDEAVLTRKASVVLPGFFRATKNWDVLVIHRRRLIAVFEFKSQVGSFGNNFNNRSEEVIGAAVDLWVAHQHGAYSDEPSGVDQEMLSVREPSPLLNPEIQHDPRPPFLGWLMLLEECPGSTTPVRVDEPNYQVFPNFRDASYAKRYQILCERLVERQIYGAAALVLSNKDAGFATGEHRSLSEATSLRTLFTEFAAKATVASSVL